MGEDWLANAYEGMSRRQFLARVSAAGVTLAGFRGSGESGCRRGDYYPQRGSYGGKNKVTSGDFQVPIYEARPRQQENTRSFWSIPEVFGMHEHIKDVTRRFAKEGFLGITLNLMRGKEAS